MDLKQITDPKSQSARFHRFARGSAYDEDSIPVNLDFALVDTHKLNMCSPITLFLP
jgi:hypothetical protein